MEISPNTFVDAQSLMQFYATLFRILVVIYGGGLAAALACILWLLRYDEMPLWVRPPRGQLFERFTARTKTKELPTEFGSAGFLAPLSGSGK
jgi:hypothetical protein